MFREKISARQLFSLLFIMRTTIVISLLPVLTSADALQDAWLSALIAFFFSAFIVIVIGRMAMLFPEKSIVQYSQDLLGTVLGKALSMLYLGMFLLMAATDIRVYAEVVKTGFLPETPLTVIVGSMVVLAVLVVYAGIEPLGRSADVILPLFLLMVLGTLVFPVNQAVFTNLQPVFARGWSPVLVAAITPVAITAQYIQLTMLVPSMVEPEKALRMALWSLAAASIVLVLFAVMVVGILGADEGSRAIFPVFKMVRSIEVTNFLERIEALTIISWGLGAYVSFSVNLYSGSKGLSQWLGMQDNRPLILPMAAVWVAFSVQGYRDFFEVQQFFQPQMIAPFVLPIILIPPAVLWLAYFIRKTRAERNEV